MYSVVKEEKNDTTTEEKIREILRAELANTSEQKREISGYSEAALDSQVTALSSPWMRFFLKYDPRPVLMKIKCPTLAMTGEKDLQVPPEENLCAIDEALKADSNKDYTVKELPGQYHLFHTAKIESPSEYAKIEEIVSHAAGNYNKLDFRPYTERINFDIV